MAKNDKILLDGIIEEKIELKIPSEKRDEVFEYFTFEQILKDFDLSTDEIAFGSIDGRNDGGIDGFYIFINGHLLTDLEKFNWPKTGSVLELWLFTCKHHDTFKQAPLDNIAATISELFDLAIEDNELKGDYSEQLLIRRRNFKQAYKRVSSRLSEFKINFCYASRGNSSDIGESIKSRAKQIEQITNDYFGNCISRFTFYGSTELIELHRKAPVFSLELPFSENLSSGETYILLVQLKEYYNFISDNDKLRRYLFDSNVRDYMGLNRVNEDIRNTLINDKSPDFWWLNNGITILATGASVVGKSIQIQDIQIVNGLQTSESVFRYFTSGGSDISQRSVLVKVIVSKNLVIRDEIIRATNNQTSVELSALHATDKIQRDIEEVLRLNDFYYERRTNYYRNQAVLVEKILTPLYLASGYVNLILKSPEQATNLKSRFMKNESSYNKVYSNSTDLEIWPKIAYVLKYTDKFLETKRPNANSISENFLKNRRQILSFLTMSRLLCNFNFTSTDLVLFDVKKLTYEELEGSWKLIKELIPFQFSKSKIKRNTLLELCMKLNQDGKIKGFDRLLHNSGLNLDLPKPKKEFKPKEIIISSDLMEKVDLLLPTQPWRPGTHKLIATEMKCSVGEVYEAVRLLIALDRRFKQKDGVVYDKEGNVIDIDTTRVDPNTLKLLK